MYSQSGIAHFYRTKIFTIKTTGKKTRKCLPWEHSLLSREVISKCTNHLLGKQNKHDAVKQRTKKTTIDE